MVRTTRNHLSNEELKKLINEQDESEILDYKENFEDAKAMENIFPRLAILL